MIQENRRTGKLLGTGQNGHRVRYEGSNEENDRAHDRRLEQTRQAGEILCPIPQSCDLVQVPECMRESCEVHRLRLEGQEDQRPVDASTEGSTCSSSGARHRPLRL